MISVLMSSTRPPLQNVNLNSTPRRERPTSQNVNRPTNRKKNQNITHLFDWQLRVGKWLFTVDRFLLCIPLKTGSYVTAIISLATSITSFSLVLLVVCDHSTYLEIYEKKLDVFICILVYLNSCVPFLVTSIFLIIGTYMGKPAMVKVYLWGTMMHVFVCILNSLTFSIYCMINNYCFQGTGKAHVVISFVFLFFYTVTWLYLLSAINSMLTLQIAAPESRARREALETSIPPVNPPLGLRANQTIKQPRTSQLTKKNVETTKNTGNRPVNRPSRPYANRTLNRPKNRPLSPNKYRPSNQPVR